MKELQLALLFGKEKKRKEENKHSIVGDGCKRCRNFNKGYCTGKDRCCGAFTQLDENLDQSN